MNKYAIIDSGSKQYTVEVGDLIQVELLDNIKDKVTFEQVLLVSDNGKTEIGAPYIKNLVVHGEVVSAEEKADKIQVFRYKSKSKYRKMRGHRQRYTSIKITAIGEDKVAPAAAPVKKVVAKKVTAKKPVVKKVAK